MELQLFKDHLQPASLSQFSTSHGWLIHVPRIPFSSRGNTLNEAPIYITEDGLEWYTLTTTEKDEKMDGAAAALHAGKDFLLLSLHNGIHGGRLQEFREGNWGRSIKLNPSNAIHHFLDVGGLVFGTESHADSRSLHGAIKYTGYHNENSREKPEDMIPVFL